MRLEIDPKGFVAVGRERYTKRAQAYFAWKEHCQLLGADLPDSGAILTFEIAMPKSWSKKKRAEMLGKPHQVRPDLSNLLKALEDAARYHSDDKTIWHYASIRKVWAETGAITIETEETENQEGARSEC